MSGAANLIQLISSLGRLLIRYLESLGLVALLGVAALGAGLTLAHSPTLGWVGAGSASLAVHAVRRYRETDGRLVFLLMLAGVLAALCLPPLWVVLS